MSSGGARGWKDSVTGCHGHFGIVLYWRDPGTSVAEAGDPPRSGKKARLLAGGAPASVPVVAAGDSLVNIGPEGHPVTPHPRFLYSRGVQW